MTETTQHQHAGNAGDSEYDAYLARVRARFGASTSLGPLFTTNVAPAALWEKYLSSFPPDQQQHHNCNACRHFIQRFGGLVVIDAAGNITPAVWDETDAYGPYVLGVERMANMVKRAKVTGVFVSGEQILGYPHTGAWRHLHVHFANVHRDQTKEPHQLATEKLQNFGTLRRGLDEFDRAVVAQAVQILESGGLYRGEKVLGAAKWLLALHDARQGKVGAELANVTWLAVATAPAGFCAPRSSMIGTLLEDIAAGLPVADIQRRFADKMDPAQYQRAQAAPKAGQIDAAERAVEALGIAPAFARRYAVAADMRGILWTPSDVVAHPQTTATAKGVFAGLKEAPAAAAALDIPAKKMTWEKFQRDVLPGAAVIEYRVPSMGPFCALTAAQDLNAPPILQWDDAGPAEDPLGQRNTVSWSFPSPPARADEWSLQAGALARVRMIVQSPNLWNDRAGRFAHQGKGAFLLLEGARDNRGMPGGGLFSEHLRSELKPYRSTIEAHMNRLTVAGADDQDAAGFGIGLFDGNEFAETAAPKAAAGIPAGAAPERIHVILLADDSGSMRSYIDAARRAMSSLLAAVRGMPGKVDVTFIRFGTSASLMSDRAPLSNIEGIERHMSGGSGGTALNDALGDAISRATGWSDAYDEKVSYFLGVVTDGEEIDSRRYTMGSLRQLVERVTATGRWTVTLAGAGRNPRNYADAIGIPPGNVTTFTANERGFAEMGTIYAASTQTMSANYMRGARASTSFFAAAPGRQAMGKDHPVLLVTSKSGARLAYELDRWE